MAGSRCSLKFHFKIFRLNLFALAVRGRSENSVCYLQSHKIQSQYSISFKNNIQLVSQKKKKKKTSAVEIR